MTWEYGLIGLLTGLIIGALAMRFGNKKFREQRQTQYELDKTKSELDDYREELTTHFAHSAELLDKMADDYRQLYKHMAKGSQSFLSGIPEGKQPFSLQLTEAGNDQAQVHIPRDYSEGASGLLRGERATRD